MISENNFAVTVPGVYFLLYDKSWNCCSRCPRKYAFCVMGPERLCITQSRNAADSPFARTRSSWHVLLEYLTRTSFIGNVSCSSYKLLSYRWSIMVSFRLQKQANVKDRREKRKYYEKSTHTQGLKIGLNRRSLVIEIPMERQLDSQRESSFDKTLPRGRQLIRDGTVSRRSSIGIPQRFINFSEFTPLSAPSSFFPPSAPRGGVLPCWHRVNFLGSMLRFWKRSASPRCRVNKRHAPLSTPCGALLVVANLKVVDIPSSLLPENPFPAWWKSSYPRDGALSCPDCLLPTFE